jgi:hypothetical protein
MDQLKMTEAQRKATLRDGQDAGEMLLDIETRIGELAEKEERVAPISVGKHGFVQATKLPKHERLGMTQHRMLQSKAISRHPEIVEKVKAQARANEDIPTRTAVINEIRYQKDSPHTERPSLIKKSSQTLNFVANSPINEDMEGKHHDIFRNQSQIS